MTILKSQYEIRRAAMRDKTAGMDRGTLFMRLSVTDPKARSKRLYPQVIVIGALLLAVLYTYLASPQGLQPWTIAVIALLAFLAFLILEKSLGASTLPIAIYAEGMQFPRFTVDRLLRRKMFVPRSKVQLLNADRKVRVGKKGVDKSTLGNHLALLTVKTKKGEVLLSGDRDEPEVRKFLFWAAQKWNCKVIDVNGKRLDAQAAATEPAAAQ